MPIWPNGNSYETFGNRRVSPENFVYFVRLIRFSSGNATSICSDKTGTLTTNRMTVVKSHISGKTFEKTPENPDSDIKADIMDMLVTGISVNSSYTSKVK